MTEAAAVIHNNLEALRDRKGVSILDLWELFPDDDHAEAWLCCARWGGNIRCVDCGSEKAAKKLTSTSGFGAAGGVSGSASGRC